MSTRRGFLAATKSAFGKNTRIEVKWEQVAGGLEEIRFFSAPGPPPGTPGWPRPEGMRSDKTTKRILAARFFSLDPSSGAEKMQPRPLSIICPSERFC